MAENNKVFPFDYSDDDLSEEIRKRAASLETANISSVMQNSPIVELGVIELQSRKSEKQEENAKLVKGSIIVGFCSIIVAISALWISNVAVESSSRWEDSQITKLNELITLSTETVIILSNIKNSNKSEYPDKNDIEDVKKLLFGIKEQLIEFRESANKSVNQTG